MKNLIYPSPIWQTGGIALVRIITGLFLAYHGWEVFSSEKMKVYGTWDQFKTSTGVFMVYLGKIAELVGGILLTFGLLTRIASLMIIGTMAYISFFVGNGRVWYEDQHPFLFVLLALVFFFTGPGAWSLDKILFSKSEQL